MSLIYICYYFSELINNGNQRLELRIRWESMLAPSCLRLSAILRCREWLKVLEGCVSFKIRKKQKLPRAGSTEIIILAHLLDGEEGSPR